MSYILSKMQVMDPCDGLERKVVAPHLYMHLQVWSICIARHHLNSAFNGLLVNLNIFSSMHVI